MTAGKLFLVTTLTVFGSMKVLELLLNFNIANAVTGADACKHSNSTLMNSTPAMQNYMIVSPPSEEESQQIFDCNAYREYPNPDHLSGLPFLGDVFAADNGTSVYFVAINQGACKSAWRGAHNFHAIPNAPLHRFVCAWPAANGAITVSDPVHRKQTPKDELWTAACMVIRCDIPESLQHLVSKPQDNTTLTVSLHATKLLERARRKNSTQQPLGHERNAFRNLPVCHGEFTTSAGLRLEPPQKKHFLSMFTRVKSSYTANGYKEKLLVPPTMILSWIEYHLHIGFDHFYIYDNDAQEHGPIETLLKPYVAQGLITYIWHPYQDCIRDYGGNDVLRETPQLRTGQYIVNNAVIRRYAHRTEYMAHLDVDEYLILEQGQKTMRDMIQSRPQVVDALELTQVKVSVCNGDSIDNTKMLPFERANCFERQKFYASYKSIVKTSRILYWFVHFTHATVYNGSESSIHDPPNNLPVRKNIAHIAHYQQRPEHLYDAPDFAGAANSSFTERYDLAKDWSSVVRKRVEERMSAAAQ